MLLTISLVFILYNIVRSERLVVNTTCLELAKPSNQQFRLSCKNASDYHCLLDEYSIEEFEVCMMWKWIPKGKCAYFNTYGDGNIDGRQCLNLTNFVCPKVVHSSSENIKYPACYVKNTTTTKAPPQSSFRSTFEDTTEGTTKITNDGRNLAVSSISDTADEQSEKALKASAIAFGVILPCLIFSAILCYVYTKGENPATNNIELGDGAIVERAESEENQQQNDNSSRRENASLQSQDSQNGLNEGAEPQDHEPLIENRRFSTIENEGIESSEEEKDDSNTEQRPLLNEMKTSSENTSQIRCEMEKNLTGKGMKDDDQKEKSVENPSHLSSRPLQSNTEDADDKKTTVEHQYTEPTLDDEKLPKNVIEAVSTQEAGKTVTT